MHINIDYREGVPFFSCMFAALKNHFVGKCPGPDRFLNARMDRYFSQTGFRIPYTLLFLTSLAVENPFIAICNGFKKNLLVM